MAKHKRPKGGKKRDSGPKSSAESRGKDRSEGSPEPLTKDIATIKREIVKINYHQREVLHELWPELFLHSISQLEASVFRAYGTYKGGLTKGEIEELKAIRLEAKALQERLVTIYYRLKFKA